MHLQIPEKANEIIHILQDAGYEAYVVGGCVRDALLGREAADWDITTSALPEQVKGLFRCTLDTGLQHGTVTVMLEREGFEVTTPFTRVKDPFIALGIQVPFISCTITRTWVITVCCMRSAGNPSMRSAA